MKRNKTYRWLKRLFLLIILATGVGYGKWYWEDTHALAVTPQFENGKVTRGDVTLAITANGQLNPVVRVDVSSQISGNIQTLFADFNTPVKAGQVIAKLDAATYEANVLAAEGNLASARAGLELAQINEART